MDTKKNQHYIYKKKHTCEESKKHFKKKMGKKIMICFLDMNSEYVEDAFVNKMAACMSGESGDAPKIIHVELFFPDEKKNSIHSNNLVGLSCSIHYKGKVFLEPKSFSKANWKFRTLSVTDNQYSKCLDFCKNAVGCDFNYGGYYLYWLPSALRPSSTFWSSSKPTYYCSELTTAALKEADVFEDTQSTKIHPHELFNLLKDKTMIDCARKWSPQKINWS